MGKTSSVNNVDVGTKSRYPSQIKYIVGNEACERYSYYGMTSILSVFLVAGLSMSEALATETYHDFKAACYFTPLLGAFISDKFWGKYKTILLLSVLYCVGHAYLALFEHTQAGFLTGLALIAIGAGGIKPCVSAHVGDQFKKGQEGMLRKIFDLFYFMINFGAVFATMITPWTYKAYGAGVAFGIPGGLMALATIIFWMGRKEFVHVPPTETSPKGFDAMLWVSIFAFCLIPFTYESFGRASYYVPCLMIFATWAYGYFSSKDTDTVPRLIYSYFSKGEKNATKIHGEEKIDGLKALFGIAKVFSMVTFFWALFDQQGSTWIFQGQKMQNMFMGYEIQASQIPSLNPFLVMALIPIFSFAIYPMLSKVTKLTSLKKIGIGMFITGFTYVSLAIIQSFLDNGVQLHILWQSIPYLIITSAEVMVSITCLEFAYTQAPRSMKSTVMSMFLLTVFFGNLVAGKVARFGTFIQEYAVSTLGIGASKELILFSFFAILMCLAAFIFAGIARNYKLRNYMEA